MTKPMQTVRLIEFHNRHIDVELKSGTIIRNLEVTNTKVFDNEGNKLESPQIIGIDGHNNEITISTDYMEAFGFLDTHEQSVLRSLIYLIDTYGQVPNLEDMPMIKEAFDKAVVQRAELEAKGVTVYKPKRVVL